MYLPLASTRHSPTQSRNQSQVKAKAHPLTVEQIHARTFANELEITDAVARWAAIGGEAFAYHIDSEAILPLTRNENVQVLMGYLHGKAVASGLLYKTGHVIGVHQVAVHPSAQGKA